MAKDALERGAALAGILGGAGDGKLVVIHDDIVDRTTNGTGYVADMNLSKLRALDAGSWFKSHFSGETIPILGEMLKLARAHGRGLYIEPKAADPAAVLHEVRAQQIQKRLHDLKPGYLNLDRSDLAKQIVHANASVAIPTLTVG
ncbi:MAG: glycerophosphodiester phosphodiesterase family protein [Geminicoccaceae bacterium]